jgi:hypothetical protein
MKININEIHKQTQIFKHNNLIKIKRAKFTKGLIYTLLGSFSIFYLLYICNAKELFKQMKLDDKIKARIKNKEKQFNIDQEKNDKLLADFEKKYNLNYSIIEYEKRMKFGNKELNKKEIPISNESVQVSQFKTDKDDTKLFDIEKKNLDPTQIGVDVVFDKRLNK